MRICLVSPYSWSFPGGVIEHVDSVADHLERRGHEVCVIAPNDPADLRTRALHPKLGRHGRLPERVEPVGRSIPFPSNGSLGNVAFSPGVFGAVRRVLQKRRPDVVHVHEPFLPLVSWAAVKAAKLMGIPTVGTFHANYPDGCPYYRAFGRLLITCSQALDARIAVSPTAARTVAGAFPGDYRIVPNGVDVSRFRLSGGVRRRPEQVLFVGRPVARKGLPVLLEAFPEVLRRVPEARLVIAGCGSESLKVPKGLLSSVEVRGTVDEHGLVECMKSSSVLCAPSVGSESFGMVLIEGMAAGLCVVASDIPGYEAVVKGGETGVLVPPGDPLALAGALTDLLLDDARRERLSASGRVSTARYDWARISAELEGIYQGLVRPTAP